MILYEFVKSLSHFFVPKKTTAPFTREPLSDNRKGCSYGSIYFSIRAKHLLLFTLHFSLFSARQGLPLILFQINIAVVAHLDALLAKQVNLHIHSAEHKRFRYSAVSVYNPVAFYRCRVGVLVQGIADHPRPSRISCKQGYLTVGCDLALWYLLYTFVYFLKRSHITCTALRPSLPLSLFSHQPVRCIHRLSSLLPNRQQ